MTNSITGWTRRTWGWWGVALVVAIAYDFWNKTAGTFGGLL